MAKVFRVTGTFYTGHHEQNFSKEIVAESEDRARELMLSLIGSKHAVPRRLIKITAVKEVPATDIQDAVVRHMAGL
ncbi:MAG TPA: 50S ribosomal protein L18Ae [Candidatus Thermoplasmatota archaeon]